MCMCASYCLPVSLSVRLSVCLSTKIFHLVEFWIGLGNYVWLCVCVCVGGGGVPLDDFLRKQLVTH